MVWPGALAGRGQRLLCPRPGGAIPPTCSTDRPLAYTDINVWCQRSLYVQYAPCRDTVTRPGASLYVQYSGRQARISYVAQLVPSTGHAWNDRAQKLNAYPSDWTPCAYYDLPQQVPTAHAMRPAGELSE